MRGKAYAVCVPERRYGVDGVLLQMYEPDGREIISPCWFSRPDYAESIAKRRLREREKIMKPLRRQIMIAVSTL